MPDDESDNDKNKGFWPDWMTPRRGWEFIRNVVILEKSVSKLSQENRDLRVQITQLQKQVSEQGTQLKMLTDFVRTSLSK